MHLHHRDPLLELDILRRRIWRGGVPVQEHSRHVLLHHHHHGDGRLRGLRAADGRRPRARLLLRILGHHRALLFSDADHRHALRAALQGARDQRDEEVREGHEGDYEEVCGKCFQKKAGEELKRTEHVAEDGGRQRWNAPTV